MHGEKQRDLLQQLSTKREPHLFEILITCLQAPISRSSVLPSWGFPNIHLPPGKENHSHLCLYLCLWCCHPVSLLRTGPKSAKCYGPLQRWPWLAPHLSELQGLNFLRSPSWAWDSAQGSTSAGWLNPGPPSLCPRDAWNSTVLSAKQPWPESARWPHGPPSLQISGRRGRGLGSQIFPPWGLLVAVCQNSCTPGNPTPARTVPHWPPPGKWEPTLLPLQNKGATQWLSADPDRL